MNTKAASPQWQWGVRSDDFNYGGIPVGSAEEDPAITWFPTEAHARESYAGYKVLPVSLVRRSVGPVETVIEVPGPAGLDLLDELMENGRPLKEALRDAIGYSFPLSLYASPAVGAGGARTQLTADHAMTVVWPLIERQTGELAEANRKVEALTDGGAWQWGVRWRGPKSAPWAEPQDCWHDTEAAARSWISNTDTWLCQPIRRWIGPGWTGPAEPVTDDGGAG